MDECDFAHVCLGMRKCIFTTAGSNSAFSSGVMLPGVSHKAPDIAGCSVDPVPVTLHWTRGSYVVPDLEELPAMGTHNQHTSWL